MKLPRVVVVGRPNVGKSTLFNRLVGSRRALVHDQPGVTRDWTAAPIDLGGRIVELVDTGGLDLSATDPFVVETRRVALGQLERADVLMLVVDAVDGLLPADLEIAERLRQLDRPMVLVANKCDVRKAEEARLSFWELGMGEPFGVSAEHGRGFEDLRNALDERIPAVAVESVEEETPSPRVALVGRPNVGKSSLVNRLLGHDRMIVSDVPGTTRDSVDSSIRVHGREYVLVDTAGIRKAPRTATSPDVYASFLAARALARADVAVLVVDAHRGPTTKDAGIAGRIVDARRPVVILANKWDLGPPEGIGPEDLAAEVRRELPLLDYAEVLLVSAHTGRKLPHLWEAVDRALASYVHRIPTAELNRWAEQVVKRGKPLEIDGAPAKLRYVTQIGIAPPTFALFASRQGSLAAPSLRFVENRLRELHPFTGSPIVLRVAGTGGEARPRRERGASGGGRPKPRKPRGKV